MTSQEAAQQVGEIAQNGSQQPLPEIEDALQTVEQIMLDVVGSDVTVLHDAAKHILKAGGKRIRPRMVLLSYAASGGTDLQKAIPVAAAVELVHTASVVHDDINDHGIVRRGRPSINAIWGRTFALLTGDFLFTKVYELMAPYGDLNIVFAEAAIALVEGETLQAKAVKDNNFTREVYYEIIARKTAALFRAGATLGGKLTDAREDVIDGLAQYGFNIGLAFQIIDDILDLTSDEEQLGKTSGIDVPQGKGFAMVREDGGAKTPLATIREKFNDGNAIRKGQQQAREFVRAATSALDVLPESPYKDAMIDLAHVIKDRSY